MIYQIPEDPRTPVWDKNQQEWEPDRPGYYGRKFGSTRQVRTWPDLVAKHGPLTDYRVPEVGETITVAGGDSIPVEEVPEDAVFISENVVCVRVGNIFKVSGSNKIRGYLYPGEWTRLR
ncbi:hypothetical protein [Trueperella pyogenes]